MINNSSITEKITPGKKVPSPSEFLKQAFGRQVTVKLINNVEYKGLLLCLDGHMNLALEQVEEIINGQITNRYPSAFIRGNNVFYINSSQSKTNK